MDGWARDGVPDGAATARKRGAGRDGVQPLPPSNGPRYGSTAANGQPTWNRGDDYGGIRGRVSALPVRGGLLTADDLSPTLRDEVQRAYIYYGYRVNLTTWECIKGLFVLSNETVNIWSHLIPTVYFVVLLAKEGSQEEGYARNVRLAQEICAIIGLFGSTLCHLMWGHKCDKVRRGFLATDVVTFCVAVMGSYIVFLHYGFYCFPGWRNFYLSIFAVFLSVNVISIYRCAFEPESDKKREERLVQAACVGSFPFISIFHLFLVLCPDWYTLHMTTLLRILVHAYLAGVVAMAFYGLHIPERFFPGKLWFAGYSHHWWHLVATLYQLGWYYACWELDDVIKRQPPCLAS
ncbi:progestin and adipoQ receptor family member 3-like [Branchiostoma floridae x Branchiostoma belcheri]